MDDFLLQLVPLLKKNLSPESFSKAFQYDKPLLDVLTTSRRVSSYERTHVDNLFSQFTTNDSTPDPTSSRGKPNVWKSPKPPSVPQPPSPQTTVLQGTSTQPPAVGLTRDDIIAIVQASLPPLTQDA